LTLPESTTTSTLNKKEKDNSEERAAEEEARASKNDSRLVLLYSAGIMEPTASRLLEKAWVTKDYLEAHIDRANRENTPVGLLIHRIREHDPKPKRKFDNQDPENYRRSWGVT
jgi:ABC-type methionine transport system ATPase subunit